MARHGPHGGFLMGGDDMAHLRTMDAVGKLNDQVKKLEAEGGIEIGGTPKSYCVLKVGMGKS